MVSISTITGSTYPLTCEKEILSRLTSIKIDCPKVSDCDAYRYDIIMEGKKEYPNLYTGYKEGTPDGTYKTSIVKLEEQFYADCLKYNAVMIIRETGSVSEMKKKEKEQMDLNTVNTNKQYYNGIFDIIKKTKIKK